MLGAKTQHHVSQPTENVHETGQLEGLQWGKSGSEMDEERKKQVRYSLFYPGNLVNKNLLK